MNKTILGILITILFVRFVTYPSPLPSDWDSKSKIGFTTTVLDFPQYTDSQTIIRSGIWIVRLKGYKEIIPGTKIKLIGAVEPKVVMGKTVQIKMTDPSIQILGEINSISLASMAVQLNLLRSEWRGLLRRTLPEPMASLSGGILLGVKDQMPNEFYESLVRTGTVHIVAASGYNVAIVAGLIIRVVSTLVGRGTGVAISIIGIAMYVVMAGGGASVVRAGIMGGLTLAAYYSGRPADSRRLLWAAAFLMLLINPLLILDVGFQLSFAATLGLLYLPSKLSQKRGLLGEYLIPTLVAAVATAPIILWHFGRVSWISPISNLLVLPFVPVIMELSAILILVGSISLSGARIVSWLLYPVLWYIVFVIRHL